MAAEVKEMTMISKKIGTVILTGFVVASGVSAQAGSGSARRPGSGSSREQSRTPRVVARHTPAALNRSPHAPFTALLRKHVRDGRVSYRGFKADEAELDRYLGYIARTDPARLTRAQQLAFWINAYNAFTVKLILESYPGIKSIKDYWGPWKRQDWVVNGKKVSLGHIEHKVLRKMNEPRIHVAIVCASFSCPDLASEAYEADRLDSQLTAAMKAFLGNPKKGMKASRENGMIYGTNEILYLSKIFSWFQGDFGRNPKAVLKYLAPFMTQQQRLFIQKWSRSLKIKYLAYDWTLNGT